MSIQSASINMSQTNLQEQAAMQVQKMSLDALKEQMTAVEKLIASVEPLLDPNLGKHVDISV